MTESHSTAEVKILDDLVHRHRGVLDECRPEAVAKQRSRGQLTARERIAELLDEGEKLWESGPLAVPAGEGLTAAADGLVVGIGRVHSRPSVIVSCDYTSLGGSLGVTSHAKLTRAMYLAERYELPVFVLAEGGGARVQEYQSLPSVRPAKAFGTMARLSGRVPLVGLALGRAFAGHAILLGECDTVIATESAAMGIAGPPLVKAATGLDLTPEEIGGSDIQAEAGSVEKLVQDDKEAITEARRYAAYFFQRYEEPGTAPQANVEDLRAAVARATTVEVREAAASIADAGSIFELRPTWAPEVMTTLARVDGQTVALTAVGPGDGSSALDLTRDHCDKLARFHSLCEAFGIPEIRIIGSVTIGEESDDTESALFRYASRLVRPGAADGTPSVNVIVGELSGATQILLGAFSDFLSGPFHFMWPNAVLRGLGAEEQGTSAYQIAEAYSTDDVIDPGETRQTILEVLTLLNRDLTGTRTSVDLW